MATPPVFTAGSVLTAAQMNAVGLWLVKKVTTITSNNIEVHNCFSADYEAYKIVFSNLTANTAGTCEIEFYTGSAYTTSGIYATRTQIQLGTTTFSGVVAANNGGIFSLGMVADTNPTGGWMEVQNPFLSARTTFQFGGSDSRSTGNGSIYGSGVVATNTSYTGFRVKGGGANLTAGTVAVYGYRL